MAETYEGLFVKFGADVTEFDNSVKGINRALTSLRKDVSNVNKQLKFNPGNVDLLTRKLENFQEQARIGALKIKELKKQQSALGDEKVGTEEWNKLQLEIDKVEGQMQSVDAAAKRTERQLKEAADPNSVTNLDKALAEVASDLDTVNKKLQLNPNDVEAAAEKTELLGKQAELSEKKVDALKKEQKALGKEKVGTEEWKRLEKQIVEAQIEAKEYKNTVDDVGSSSTNLDGIGGKIDTGNLQEASQTIGQIGDGMISAGEKSLEAFNIMDEGLDTITAKTGEASDGYKEMYNAIISDVPVENVADIGEAIGELRTQFDYTGPVLQDMTTYMLKFAQVNSSDVTTSTINAKKAMELFGLSADQLPQVLDAVTSTSQSTGVSVDELFANVQKGAPALQRMGLDFSQSVQLMGEFQKAGFDSNKTIMGLTKAAGVYAAENKTLDQGLAETSKVIQNAKTDQEAMNEAVRVFGTRNAPAMVDAIKSGKLNLESLGTAAEDNAGKVGDTFEKQLDPIDKLTIAENELTSAMAELGNALAEVLGPALQAVAGFVRDLATWFTGLSPTMQKIVVAVLAIVAALAVLTPIIVGVITFVTSLQASLVLMNTTMGAAAASILPIIGVIAGVIAAIIAIIIIIKNWGKITDWLKEKFATLIDFFSNLWNGIKGIFGVVLNIIKTVIMTVFNGIKMYLSTVWGIIKTVFVMNLNIIKTLVTTVFKIIQVIIKTVFAIIKAIIKGDFGAIKNIFKNALNSIKSIVSSAWASIKNFFSNGVSSILSIVSGIKEKIASKFKNLASAIKGAIGNLADIGKAIINGILDGLGNIGTAIKNKIVEGLRSAKSNLGDVARSIFGKAYIGDMGGLNLHKYKDAITPTVNNMSGGATTSLNIQVTANNTSGLEIAKEVERVIVRRLT